MNIFTPEEIEAFTKKVMQGKDEDDFVAFYEVCAERAKEETKFQHSMFMPQVMTILQLVVMPIWGPVEKPTDKQMALMHLAMATTHEIFDRMVSELMEKNKENDKLN